MAVLGSTTSNGWKLERKPRTSSSNKRPMSDSLHHLVLLVKCKYMYIMHTE